MLWGLLEYLSSILFLFLHITSAGWFPKALTAAEEKKYLEQMAAGDHHARQKLIEHNLRLVAHIAKKYYADENDRDDLVSIGTVGLIKAVDSFDPTKGIRLSSYASRCIENEILMYLRRNNKTKMEVSIDEPLNVDWDGNELLLSDILGTDENVIYNKMEEEVNYHLLYKALAKLSPREKTIIQLRFGIRTADGEEKTQKEVADFLGISQSYISRLEKKIIGRLKKDIVRMEGA